MRNTTVGPGGPVGPVGAHRGAGCQPTLPGATVPGAGVTVTDEVTVRPASASETETEQGTVPVRRAHCINAVSGLTRHLFEL